MKWSRTEFLDKLHLSGVFILLLFASFRVGNSISNRPSIFGVFGMAWRGADLGG
jgi:hypothetical protein